jgi:octaprenyl-diphosphate synthase
LNNCDRATKNKIIHIFKNAEKNKHEVRYVIDEVKKHGGIEYAEEKMNIYKQEAIDLLQIFPESETKKHMIDLVHYITNRTS